MIETCGRVNKHVTGVTSGSNKNFMSSVHCIQVLTIDQFSKTFFSVIIASTAFSFG